MKRPKPKKKMKHLRFDPACPFEVARAISKALEGLSGSTAQAKATRWALEEQGFSYPIRIQGGANYQ